MAIKDQLEREKKVNDEIKRLKKIYSKEENKSKIKVLESLIEQTAFMKLTLQELKDDLFKNGHTEMYENGPQAVKRERPESKIYNVTIQRYSNVMKQLIDYMPAEEKKEEKDELMEFLKRNTKASR